MMRRWLLALLVILTPSFAWASHDSQEDVCHNTWVLWCENFEDRSTTTLTDLQRAKYKNPGISLSPSAVLAWTGLPGMQVVTGQGVNGGKALQTNWPAAGPGTGPRPPAEQRNGGDGFWVAQGFGAEVAGRTLYWRYYEKFSPDFQFQAQGHKSTAGMATLNQLTTVQPLINHGGGPSYPRWPEVRMTPPNVAPGIDAEIGVPANRNIGAVPLVLNRNYCVEVRATLATGPGTADGYFQMWLDGIQTHEYPNLQIGSHQRSPDYSPWSFISNSGYANCANDQCTDAQDTHPDQERWSDDYVIGTQRIGCVGSQPPPPDPDDDGDGVPNSTDLCPTQPGPASNNGCPANPVPPPINDPISHWELNETSGTTADDTQNRNDGTHVNGPTIVTGIIGAKALSFDGADDYVSAGAVGFNRSEHPVSVCTWFRYATLPAAFTGMAILTNLSNPALGMFLGFYDYNDGNGLRVGAAKPGVGWFVHAALPAINSDHHICYTRDSTNHRVYLDGTLSSTVTIASAPAPAAGVLNVSYLGGFPIGAATADPFNGILDDVRIYNRDLTQSEITALATLAAPPTGQILIDRVGSDGLVSTTPAPSTLASVNSGAQSGANPAQFLNLSAASHNAQATDITNYTETYGSCTYAVGAAACTVSSWPSSPTCASSLCTAAVTVTADTVTRVSFKYTLIAPTAPSGTTVAQVSGQTHVLVTWTDNATSETAFRLQRKTGAGAYGDLQTFGADVISYVDTTTAGGTQYTYQVRAENSTGNSAYAASSPITPSAVTNDPAPTISAVSTATVTRDRPTPQTVTGTNFVAGTMATISSTGCSVSNLLVMSATSITMNVICTTSAALTLRDLTVVNPDGDNATLVGAFTVAAGHDIYARSLTWTWEDSAPTTPDSFTVKWGTVTLTYTKIHKPIAYADCVDVGSQHKCGLPLKDLGVTLVNGTATIYLIVCPNIGQGQGTCSAEETIVLVGTAPPDVPGNVEVE